MNPLNIPESGVPRPERLGGFARRSAAVGALVWLLLLLPRTSDSHETELIHKVVFFAMLVIVPLGLSLVTVSEQRLSAVLYRLAVLGQPLAAVVTIVSFFLKRDRCRRRCRRCGWLSAGSWLCWD